MNNASKNHWERIYGAKPTKSLSWFQPSAERSLAFIQKCSVPSDAAIIDIGGGASTLVDDLLRQGYSDITVLDLAGAALATTKARLDNDATRVKWIEADVTKFQLAENAYDIWHDRAVFHFLTTPDARKAYVESAFAALKPGGHVIISTFGEDGPTQCSGLPVIRYNVAGLHRELGDRFVLVSHETEEHHTPAGSQQRFIYCHFRKKDS